MTVTDNMNCKHGCRRATREHSCRVLQCVQGYWMFAGWIWHWNKWVHHTNASATEKDPSFLKEEVKTKLDTLTKQCIIEQVESPTPWISHLQPVRKLNGTVRLCLDPQNLNQALKRNHYLVPDIDDVLPQLAEAKMFQLIWCERRFLTREIVWRIKSSHHILDPLRQVEMEANAIWYFDRTIRVPEKTLECLERTQRCISCADDILICGKDQA